jgi:hypothetical protein
MRRVANVRARATAIALLACGACNAGPQVERRMAGDTVVVRTQIPAQLDTATLAIDARYALPVAAGDTTPRRITALTRGEDGNVYIATDAGVIYGLGPDHVVSVLMPASRDGGPDRTIRALLVARDSSVVARMANGAVTAFTRDGEPVREWEAGGISGLGSAQLLTRAAQGIQAGLAGIQAGDSARGMPIAVRLGDDGTVQDTVYASLARAQACKQGPDPHFRSGEFGDIRVRYVPSLHWTTLPSGGMVIGCNARYGFAIINPAGKVVRVEHDYTPAAVAEDERASFIAAWTLRMRNAEPGPQWSWRGAALPDHKPAYHRILAGSDDRIWVWPAQPSVSVAAPPQWVLVGGPRRLWVEPGTGAFDVFDAMGAFSGRVRVPGELGYAVFGTTPGPLIEADTLWWAVADSAGAHTLVRTHVTWPRPSLARASAENTTRGTRSARKTARMAMRRMLRTHVDE